MSEGGREGGREGVTAAGSKSNLSLHMRLYSRSLLAERAPVSEQAKCSFGPIFPKDSRQAGGQASRQVGLASYR